MQELFIAATGGVYADLTHAGAKTAHPVSPNVAIHRTHNHLSYLGTYVKSYLPYLDG